MGDIFDVTVLAKSLKLLADAISVRDVLGEVTTKLCCIKEEVFCALHETHKLQSEKCLFGSVDLLLSDPLYNTMRQQDHTNTAHDQFWASNINAFFEFVRIILEWGGHGNMFCFKIQFAFRRRQILAITKVVEKKPGRVEVFNLERTPFYYSRQPVHYTQDA